MWVQQEGKLGWAHTHRTNSTLYRSGTGGAMAGWHSTENLSSFIAPAGFSLPQGATWLCRGWHQHRNSAGATHHWVGRYCVGCCRLAVSSTAACSTMTALAATGTLRALQSQGWGGSGTRWLSEQCNGAVQHGGCFVRPAQLDRLLRSLVAFTAAAAAADYLTGAPPSSSASSGGCSEVSTTRSHTRPGCTVGRRKEVGRAEKLGKDEQHAAAGWL